MKWFVYWTLSGREQKAKKIIEKFVKEAGLEDKVGRILVPSQTVPKVRHGKRVLLEKPLFRGYILIEMEPDPDVIKKLINLGTVRALIAQDTLTSLSDEEVERIMETVEREKRKREQEVPFLKGEMVRVIDGPFSDFTGKVEEVFPERGQLKVMVNIFGRTTPVVLDFMQVERI
jgi:transcriptional antiterminator NusG